MTFGESLMGFVIPKEGISTKNGEAFLYLNGCLLLLDLLILHKLFFELIRKRYDGT